MEPSNVGTTGADLTNAAAASAAGIANAVATGDATGTLTASAGTPTSAWLILLLAGVLEVGMALGIRSSDGFTKLWPSVAAVAFGAASMYLLSLALRVIPAGVGYAVWTGIGALGVMLVGVTVLKEPATVWRFVCAALIVAGVAGLHAGARGH